MAVTKWKRDELFNEGRRRSQGLPSGISREFICPICGGIATVRNEEMELNVECHACGASKRGKAHGTDDLDGRRGRKGIKDK